MPSPTRSCAPGVRATCPETKTSPPALIACEYGAPWNGAGACSVRTGSFSSIWLLPSGTWWTARRGECDTERLEHRLEDVLRVVAGDQPYVEVQAGAVGEAAEEVGDQVGLEAADAGVGQVDVRGEQRPIGDL